MSKGYGFKRESIFKRQENKQSRNPFPIALEGAQLISASLAWGPAFLWNLLWSQNPQSWERKWHHILPLLYVPLLWICKSDFIPSRTSHTSSVWELRSAKGILPCSTLCCCMVRIGRESVGLVHANLTIHGNFLCVFLGVCLFVYLFVCFPSGTVLNLFVRRVSHLTPH